MALGQDNSEANYVRLRDVKSRLSTLDGTEALIEGFGDQSAGLRADGAPALEVRALNRPPRRWTPRIVGNKRARGQQG